MNNDVLEELAWAIEASEGEFTLFFARCNYGYLQEELVRGLREKCSLPIHEIHLQPSVKTLYTTLVEDLGQEKPAAVMVFGLESVAAIEEVLTSTNNVREEFRKNCPFPLVLWVNDQILHLLIRLVPDFKSWGTTFNFRLAVTELIDFLSHCTQEILREVLTAGEFVSNTEILGYSHRQEIESALQDLQARAFFQSQKSDVGAKHLGDNLSVEPNVYNPNASPSDSLKTDPTNTELTPELAANLQFILGRDDYARNEIEQALEHYQQCGEIESLEWQGMLLLHQGWCYCRQAEQEKNDGEVYWQKAKQAFEQAINCFEQVQRQDLVALYINQLAEVLRKLADWDELEVTARKSLKLGESGVGSRESGVGNKLAQDYSFLAEVALNRRQWQKAKQLAQQALSILPKPLPSPPLQGEGVSLLPSSSPHLLASSSPHPLPFLILAQALRQLRQTEEAINCLEVGIKVTQPQADPPTYVKLLAELRSLYFSRKEYLKAFEIKQFQQAIELQFRLRAFVGAGQLQPALFGEEDGGKISSSGLTQISSPSPPNPPDPSLDSGRKSALGGVNPVPPRIGGLGGRMGKSVHSQVASSYLFGRRQDIEYLVNERVALPKYNLTV
ncbi:MAG: hypothetical protein WA919_06890, partial [Coleofasciculaceae cyanobacterium]